MIKPLFDRVVIEPIKLDEMKFGIVLPEHSGERAQTGIVVAVGDGYSDKGNITMQVKVGNKVMFNRYAGAEISFNDKNYLVMKQIDVLGVIDD